MPLTQQQLETYNEQGYLVVDNVLPPDVLRTLRERIEQITALAAAGSAAEFSVETELDAKDAAPLRKLNDVCKRDSTFLAIAARDDLLDLAAQLTANAQRIMLYSDQVFMKAALCGSEKPLHQDNSYFRVAPSDHAVTCWIAVDDATVENGCMNYVPRSHKLGLLPHKLITPLHLTPEDRSASGEEVPVPVKAGGCIFHHLLTLHGSKANRSPHPRRAWAVHYCNRDAASSAKSWDKMIQLR